MNPIYWFWTERESDSYIVHTRSWNSFVSDGKPWDYACVRRTFFFFQFFSLPLLWTKRIENAGESDKKQLPRTTVTVLNYGDVFHPEFFATTIDRHRLQTLRVWSFPEKETRKRKRHFALVTSCYRFLFVPGDLTSTCYNFFFFFFSPFGRVNSRTNSLSTKNS